LYTENDRFPAVAFRKAGIVTFDRAECVRFDRANPLFGSSWRRSTLLPMDGRIGLSERRNGRSAHRSAMRSLFGDLVAIGRAFAPSRFAYREFCLAIGIGLVGALIFIYLNAPLPWMLGSMTASTIAALAGARISAPSVVRMPMVLIVGVMVGATFSPQILQRFPEWWQTVVILLLLSVVLGAVCTIYLRAFSGFNWATAYFSAMPGGLIEMVTLAEEHRGDIRTVALVHSVRILVIVFCVPIIVRLIEGVSTGSPGVLPFSVVDMSAVDLLWIFGTGIAGVVVGRLLKMPAAYLLGPLAASAFVHVAGISEFKLPAEFLYLAQLVIGTSVGCRFVGVTSLTVFRIIRVAFGMALIFLGFTALFAWLAAELSDYGFVPVFLAYAPGGLPEMSLVAIALHIEVAFVAFHHIVRLFMVMGGAPLAYALVGRVGKS
jgi:membrane AbrB-like protein